MKQTQQAYFMHSERIGFRTWTESDFDLAFKLWSNPEVTQLFYKEPLSSDLVRERLEKERNCERAHHIQYWPIFSLETDEFLGCAGLRPHKDEQTEFGVHLLPKFWRCGYASEAGSHLLKYAFERQIANTIFAGHHPNNVGSRQTLLKLGLIAGEAEFYEPTGLMHPSYYAYRVPPENVVLRPVGMNDVNGLAIVHHLSLKATFGGILDEYMAARSLPYCEEGWRKRLHGGATDSVALLRGKQIIGFASVSHSQDHDAAPTEGELSRIYLHPDVLGKSHGRTLMQWAETTLQQKGYRVMRLWVFEVNNRARAFYERMGFKLDAVEKEDFGAKLLLYKKNIQ
ncbi:MAG TPA: GNAT family N-acetyltransferase [Oculatellaceae cyanobacterium]